MPADLIVIPARFGSTRLPGKPLIEIAGVTLLARVASIARRAAFLVGDCDVIIATDDERVEPHARSLGHRAVLTSSLITSGSGRACAAALALAHPPEIVVNLQGDAPFILPEMVATLITAARRSQAACVTPVMRLDWATLDIVRAHKARSPFSGTYCVRGADGRAYWFSKSILPAIREEQRLRECEPLSPVYRHLGLYAYRLDALKRFERTDPTPYEQLEGLEQLRFLEMGLNIDTIEVAPPDHAMSGIDTAEDVMLAEELIRRLGDPHRA